MENGAGDALSGRLLKFISTGDKKINLIDLIEYNGHFIWIQNSRLYQNRRPGLMVFLSVVNRLIHKVWIKSRFTFMQL